MMKKMQQLFVSSHLLSLCDTIVITIMHILYRSENENMSKPLILLRSFKLQASIQCKYKSFNVLFCAVFFLLFCVYCV